MEPKTGDRKKRKWMAKRDLPLNCKGKTLVAEADRVGVTFHRKHTREKITLDWLTIARIAYGQGSVFNSKARVKEIIKEMGF